MNELLLDQSQQDEGLDPTNPFSEGHAERRMKKWEATEPFSEGHVEQRNTETNATRFQDDMQQHVQCIAVMQGQEDATYCIQEPISLELYYDSQSDGVALVNKSTKLLHPYKPRETDDATSGSNETHVPPYEIKKAEPGAWSCQLYEPKEIPGVAGSKRSRSEKQTPATPGSGVFRPARKIDAFRDIQKGQKLRVVNGHGDKEYHVVRLGKAGVSGVAEVFQALVSTHPKQVVVVVVKALKAHPNPVIRAKLWDLEFSMHHNLRSVSMLELRRRTSSDMGKGFIIRLLGGDARLNSLVLEYYDALDLGRRSRWRNASRFFSENDIDANRVFCDMSGAQYYLEQRGVGHNDLKPFNILNGEEGAKLIDFGHATSGPQRIDGGTPWYVGPEYIILRKRTASDDVWALEIVMLYLLKLTPLPDLGQVPGWQISNVRGP
ncbi:hypothetical protein PG991_009298 [Apiospora marii]|uniref:Protein kinase domain-containing protein n=1 Tax=Apiospora marii TaxID=335849 RepID=A0ABR1RK82_9PEZI